MINKPIFSHPCIWVFAFLQCLVLAISGAQEDLKLKPLDTVKVSIFQEAELEVQGQLTVSGELTLKLVGAVKLSGLTLTEAAEKITEKYKDGYLVSPNVTVTLEAARQERVQVTGAVGKPLEIPIPPDAPLDLMAAIELAGNLSAEADDKNIRLIRGGESYRYSLAALSKSGAKLVILKHGDRVDVGRSDFAGKRLTIIGEVGKPQVIEFPLDGQMELSTLIGLSGGLTALADRNAIRIKRGDKVFSPRANGASMLKPGDVITVPPSRFLGKTVTVTGEVKKAGAVPFALDGKFSVLAAIHAAGGFDRLANQKKVTLTRRVNGKPKIYTLNLDKIAKGEAPMVELQPGDVIFVPERII